MFVGILITYKSRVSKSRRDFQRTTDELNAS